MAESWCTVGRRRIFRFEESQAGGNLLGLCLWSKTHSKQVQHIRLLGAGLAPVYHHLPGTEEPKLDPVPRYGLRSWVEGKNHVPQPAGCPLANPVLDVIILCCKGKKLVVGTSQSTGTPRSIQLAPTCAAVWGYSTPDTALYISLHWTSWGSCSSIYAAYFFEKHPYSPARPPSPSWVSSAGLRRQPVPLSKNWLSLMMTSFGTVHHLLLDQLGYATLMV